MHFAHTITRFVRAFIYNKQGFLTNNLINHDFLTKIKQISSTDNILLWGCENLKDLLTLRQELPSKEISVFLWNPVSTICRNRFSQWEYSHFLNRSDMHIYTFDKKDALRYGFRLINQVYRMPKNHHTTANNHTEWDIFYVGMDKYRTSILERLKLLFDEQGISYNINIKRDKHTQESKILSPCYINKSIDYETSLSMIEKSKCVLEIIQNGQGGMTLRTLEAIFCDKKLITNNKDIINHPIYNPNNIYVIGNQENRSIKEFLETPQDELPAEIKNPYEITHWINTFK